MQAFQNITYLVLSSPSENVILYDLAALKRALSHFSGSNSSLNALAILFFPLNFSANVNGSHFPASISRNSCALFSQTDFNNEKMRQSKNMKGEVIFG